MREWVRSCLEDRLTDRLTRSGSMFDTTRPRSIKTTPVPGREYRNTIPVWTKFPSLMNSLWAERSGSVIH